MAGDSEPPDSTATPPAHDEPVAGSGRSAGAGEAVPVRVLGGGNGAHGGANEVPQSDPGSGGHDSDAESASRHRNSEPGSSSSASHANGATFKGSPLSHPVPLEQLRSERLDAGSNGHVVQSNSSTPEEDRSAASAKVNARGSEPPANPSAGALDTGSDEDEESWLKKRKHRLPWQ